jgi:hypothetical protein
MPEALAGLNWAAAMSEGCRRMVSRGPQFPKTSLDGRFCINTPEDGRGLFARRRQGWLGRLLRFALTLKPLTQPEIKDFNASDDV